MINEQIQHYEELLDLGRMRADIYRRLVIFYRRKRLYDLELKAIDRVLNIYPVHQLVTAFYLNRRQKVLKLMGRLHQKNKPVAVRLIKPLKTA